MRKLLLALFAMLMLMGSTVSFGLAQDDATPEADDVEAAEGTNPVDPKVGDTVTYYAENGDAVANVTVNSIERGWEDYDEYSEPDRGMEFVAFTVVVESTIERGAIDVEPYDFSLQTASGGYWGTAYASAEDAEPPLLEDAVSLADGDSEEFTIVFAVLEDEPLAHLFWGPDSGVFLTLAQLEDE
jgi:hypothetical protein